MNDRNTATKMSHPDEYLTYKDLSRELRVCIRTLKRWKKAGSIPFYKNKRMVRFNLREVLQSMQSGGHSGGRKNTLREKANENNVVSSNNGAGGAHLFRVTQGAFKRPRETPTLTVH